MTTSRRVSLRGPAIEAHQRERIVAWIGEMERRHGEGRDRKSIATRELVEFRDAANAERVWGVRQPNDPLAGYLTCTDTGARAAQSASGR